MFDAAHAALLAVAPELPPTSIKTHRGLIAAFGKHLVQDGPIAATFGAALNKVERLLCWLTIRAIPSALWMLLGPSHRPMLLLVL